MMSLKSFYLCLLSIRIFLCELLSINNRLLLTDIWIVTHGLVEIDCPREVLSFEQVVLVWGIRVLNKTVSRWVLNDKVEREVTTISEFFHFLQVLIDLSCRGWIMLASLLLQFG